MLIAMTLSCLFVIAAIATAASLIDSWVQGRIAFAILQRERRLLRAGFVPQVEARETRLRHPMHRAVKRPAQRASVPRGGRGFGGERRSRLGAIQSLG